MDAISSIAELLSLCGIASVRMFAPTFLFGAICRFMPGCSWCPDGVIELAKSCPSFLTSNFGLFVFGVLAQYEKRSSRIIAKLIMRFIKLTILLVAIVFSSIPFLGIILLLPYLISYLIRAHKVSQQVFEHVA